MYNAPLYERLKHLAQSDPARFFMPGHKGGKDMEDNYLAPVMPYDVTELSETGNLYVLEGIVEEAQELCAKAFGAQKARFLVGGATEGIHTALWLAAKRGKAVLIDRFAHRSVINGCILADMSPNYIWPNLLKPYAIGGAFCLHELEKKLCEKQYAAFVVTSPTYYGVVQDIAAMQKICDKYKTLLIVDSAHGAHLGFSGELPPASQHLGADFVVASAHKTLGALTQGAYLFCNNQEFLVQEIIDATAIFGTSSPSYLIMASLDWARAFMEKNGAERLNRLANRARWAAGELEKTGRFSAITRELCKMQGVDLDETRLVIDCAKSGYSAKEIYTLLEEKGIVCEMALGRLLVALPSVHSTDADFERLVSALKAIPFQKEKRFFEETEILPRPSLVLDMRKAAMAEREYVKLEESLGRICARPIDVFPPGVMLVAPGEQIDAQIHVYLKEHSQDGVFVVK